MDIRGGGTGVDKRGTGVDNSEGRVWTIAGNAKHESAMSTRPDE